MAVPFSFLRISNPFFYLLHRSQCPTRLSQLCLCKLLSPLIPRASDGLAIACMALPASCLVPKVTGSASLTADNNVIFIIACVKHRRVFCTRSHRWKEPLSLCVADHTASISTILACKIFCSFAQLTWNQDESSSLQKVTPSIALNLRFVSKVAMALLQTRKLTRGTQASNIQSPTIHNFCIFQSMPTLFHKFYCSSISKWVCSLVDLNICLNIHSEVY